MSLSAKNVQKIVGDGVMSASEIAIAGGWDFYDTVAFMKSISSDEVETRGGFECFTKAGVGTVYKWICGETRQVKCAPNFSTDVQESIVIAYLKEHPNCTVKAAKDTGLSPNQISKTMGRLVKKEIVKSIRSGLVPTYYLAV